MFEAEVNKVNMPGKWFHNGTEVLATSDKHDIFGKGVIHRLTVRADGTHEGTYKLEVKGMTHEAKLVVEGRGSTHFVIIIYIILNT